MPKYPLAAPVVPKRLPKAKTTKPAPKLTITGGKKTEIGSRLWASKYTDSQIESINSIFAASNKNVGNGGRIRLANLFPVTYRIEVIPQKIPAPIQKITIETIQVIIKILSNSAYCRFAINMPKRGDLVANHTKVSDCNIPINDKVNPIWPAVAAPW